MATESVPQQQQEAEQLPDLDAQPTQLKLSVESSSLVNVLESAPRANTTR